MPLRIARRVRRFLAFRRLCAKLALRYGRLQAYSDAQIERAARAARARLVLKEAMLALGAGPPAGVRSAQWKDWRRAFAQRHLFDRYPFDARDVVNAFAPRAFPRFDFPNRYVRTSPRF